MDTRNKLVEKKYIIEKYSAFYCPVERLKLDSDNSITA